MIKINKKLLEKEMSKRKLDRPAEDVVAALRGQLFKQQLAFVEDKSEYSAASCSRQAGKTYSIIVDMVSTVVARPDRNVAYLALTRKSAKAIAWRETKRQCKRHGIRAKFNEAELVIYFENGSIIQFGGANESSIGETLRGVPWDLVVIDEAASFRGHIKQMIEECIAPSFITRKGRLRIIGTPSPDFGSYFYEAVHSAPEFTKHHWTSRDNPFIEDVEDFLKKTRRKKGWSEDNPIYLREYEGKWIKGDGNNVYSYNALRNQASPDTSMEGLLYILGADLGFNDSNAAVVLAYNPEKTRHIYVVEQFKRSRMLLSEFGCILQGLVDKYKPVRAVCDEGGLGKAIAEDLNTRFSLCLTPAQKTKKLGFIELLNSDLTEGYLQIINEENGLAEEWSSLVWDEKSKKQREDPSCENHLADATLYAWRECVGYLFGQTEEEVAPIVKRFAMASATETEDDDYVSESRMFAEWDSW